MSTNPPAKPMKIVKSSELPWSDALKRGQFDQQRKDLGAMQMLRCGLWSLAPGKKSFPFHRHHATEEAMFVISGTGQVRTEDGLTPVGPGDYITFPAGGPAHQLINDGSEPLVYMGISANAAGMDVVEYPDSNKVANSVGGFPATKRFIFSSEQQLDYFHGEKDA